MSIVIIPAVIAAAFFVAGAVLGVSAIISLSAASCDQCSRTWPQHDGQAYRPRYGRDIEPQDDSDYPGYPPRWPGGGYPD